MRYPVFDLTLPFALTYTFLSLSLASYNCPDNIRSHITFSLSFLTHTYSSISVTLTACNCLDNIWLSPYRSHSYPHFRHMSVPVAFAVRQLQHPHIRFEHGRLLDYPDDLRVIFRGWDKAGWEWTLPLYADGDGDGKEEIWVKDVGLLDLGVEFSVRNLWFPDWFFKLTMVYVPVK